MWEVASQSTDTCTKTKETKTKSSNCMRFIFRFVFSLYSSAAMASKRGATDAASPSSSGAPPAKKLMTQFEPVKIGPIATLVSAFCIIFLKTFF